MTLAILSFLILAALAAGFAAIPFLRAAGPHAWRGRRLAVLSALGVIALAAGVYAATGRVELAARAFKGPSPDDFRALVATLAQRIRERPDDSQGWTLLGRGYLALGAPDHAAKALSRAIALSETAGTPSASLYALYGEALAQDAGQITGEAEDAFEKALTRDPRDASARYYLGLAARGRGEKEKALSYWEGLLGDAAADAPWRHALADEVGALKAETGGGADIEAMVAGLAARLEKNPDDLAGWMRLVRAYAVMGEAKKAREALARARAQFVRNESAHNSLNALARDLAIEERN
ncbi:MAG: tetratricopeptide repeat protein [Alphaproteobacteria bacterium]